MTYRFVIRFVPRCYQISPPGKMCDGAEPTKTAISAIVDGLARCTQVGCRRA
ncbi:hypothetical protein BGZ61DRAFT_463235 [Ilyonectria robusta]|uniref:uncharacterized protein n=1 Tax=Ilyonectria robusta TaxID=1079257 RepID=UPI001E8E80FF|nr:uncharacterized protein BGZ61DRAFT_463235 [Ilyonectria robusta]KAH8662765.1 hypothetical protein BGZ61DRAFT_463235 [Ilyonectria robusta]